MLTVKWIDEGAHFGKTNNIATCFIIDKEEIKEGQKVRVQLSKKKESRAKVWTGEIVAPPNVDKHPREPKKISEAHIRKAQTQFKEDEFTFSTGSPPPPIRIDLTSTKQLKGKK